jgi:hypothetical protein
LYRALLADARVHKLLPAFDRDLAAAARQTGCEELGITADTALRLAKLFGTSTEFWLNLQGRYDIETAKARIGEQRDAVAPVQAA